MTQKTHSPACKEVPELLPWLLNGTLAEEEEHFVQAHLAECESCCRDLEQAVDVWQMVTTHVPSLAIAQYAQGLEPQDLSRDLIEQHLASCASCRQELALATPGVLDFTSAFEQRTASGQSVQAQPALAQSPSKEDSWRKLAVAASLTAVAATGALMWNALGVDSSTIHPLETMAMKPVIESVADDKPASSSVVFESGFDDLSGWTVVVGGSPNPESAQN